MIIAEELIEEYKEHYEVDRLKAIKMVLEDLRLAGDELSKLQIEEWQKNEAKRLAEKEGGEQGDS